MSKEDSGRIPFAETGHYMTAYSDMLAQHAVECGIESNITNPPDSEAAKWDTLKKTGFLVGATALAAGAAMGFGFEIGPWNEALRIDVGFDVLKGTQDEVAVGLVIAGLTAVIEAVPSSLLALNLNVDTKLATKLNAYIRNRSDKKEILQEARQINTAEKEALKPVRPMKDSRFTALTEDAKFGIQRATKALSRPFRSLTKFGADAAISLGVGAAGLVAARHFEGSEQTLKQDMKLAAKGTAIVSAVSGLIGYTLAGGIRLFEKIGLEKPAQLMVDYGTNRGFWMAIFGGGYLVGVARDKYTKHALSSTIDEVKEARRAKEAEASDQTMAAMI